MPAPKKSRLGRGLDSLIAGGFNTAPVTPPQEEKTAKKKSAPAKKAAPQPEIDGYQEIPVDKVEPNPHQPRREIKPEAIQELADSIRSEGLLQPIVVRRVDKTYQLIAGERRWRACQHLKMKTVPARVIRASESSSAVIALIENLQRENLNPIEESLGYASLMRDFDLTQEQVSERLGRSRSSVANSLRLLQLDREIQAYISKGHLSVGHAKALLGLEEPDQRMLLARRAIERGLSVRETERMVQALKRSKHTGTNRAPRQQEEDQAIQSLEKRLMSELNTKVELKHNTKRGKIVIDYYGNEDLERILNKLGLDG